MLAFIENYDALLSPVAPYVAPFHGTTFDDDKLRGAGYMQMHNLTGWPSATVRVGTSPEGLPINVQVAARPWREDVALAMARYLEEVFGGVEDAANLIFCDCQLSDCWAPQISTAADDDTPCPWQRPMQCNASRGQRRDTTPRPARRAPPSRPACPAGSSRHCAGNSDELRERAFARRHGDDLARRAHIRAACNARIAITATMAWVHDRGVSAGDYPGTAQSDLQRLYAVTKRKVANGDIDFEPVVSAATRVHGDQVEIRIRDNEMGIPTEFREKIFNPFFTTKPAGEGTGLGLSISHDIIVKQHGGQLEVSSVPGNTQSSRSHCRAQVRSSLGEERASERFSACCR